ncbi:MAG: UvrD-helicase domain-containing protein [Bacteroidales bacterium]|nr:UvrD-helicase domain-containing protein [Bacteroidales bacterium]
MEDNHRLTLYKASAGSGKTYTLTQEYIRHLMKPGTDARHILAITFTNAATADMKRKIVETLREIAQGNYPAWTELLSGKERKILEANPAGESEWKALTSKRAEEKLQHLLHRYQDFSIRTIDSFVQNLVRPFAFELGLPQNYTPDIELDRFEDEITERLIDECGRPGMETQTELLTEFLHKRDESGRSLNISQSIHSVVERLFSENSFEALESMRHLSADDFKAIITRIRSEEKRIESECRNLLAQGKSLIEQNSLEAIHFHEGKNGVFGWFNAPHLPLQKIARPGTSVQKSVNKGILKKESPLSRQFASLYEKLVQYDWGMFYLLQEISDSIYSLALVNRANDILEEIKESTAVIPISEFNQRIDKALANESNDFIFERSGTRYRHVFIDEFQDTSRLQWKNLRPLIENNLAQGNACLIVGDPKQSIYRFRNADIQQFVDLCQGREGLPVKVKNLQSNWRSDAGIIAFNNLFYRFIKETYRFSEADSPQNGLVEAIFSEHEQFYKDQTQTLPEADARAVRIYLARNMAGPELEDWYLAQTLQIVRQFAPGDVTVLCRKNDHCRAVADFLVANGIKIATPDSLILGTHEGLKLAVASLRYIDSGERFHRAEAFLLAKQLGLWPQSGLFDTGNDLYGQWKHASCKARFEQLFHIGESQTDIYDTVEAVLRFWCMDQNADQYILSFLDIVQSHGFGRLADLLDWWDTYAGKTAVCAGADADAVKVMSIHKSKGLEFKVVVMPFIKDTKMKSDDLYWLRPGLLPQEWKLPTALVRYLKALENGPVGKDIQMEKCLNLIDNLNTLYVATTRPRQQLFLLTAESKTQQSAFKTNEAIARFAEAYPDYLEKREDGAVLEDADNTKKTSLSPAPASADEARSALLESHPWRERFSAALPARIQTPQIEWGNFMHRTLSLIETFTTLNLENSLKRSLNEYPQFKPREKEAREKLRKLFSDPLLQPYFSGDYVVKAETCIASPEGKLHIPDRVLLKGDTAVVLDYKTGAPHSSYILQIQQYMALITQMDVKHCRGFLVYIDQEITVREVE